MSKPTPSPADAREAKSLTDLIHERLREKFNDYIYLREMRIGTGWGVDGEGYMDAWAICALPSKGNTRVTFEIKVSRTDFCRELRKPLKRRAGLLLSNQFYFVTPPKLLKPEEIPPECGLIEVNVAEDRWSCVDVVVPAPNRDSIRPPWRFMAAFARRASRADKANTKESP